jgi:chromosome segregation ATPase
MDINERIFDKLEKLDDKIEKLDDKLDSVDKTLVRNTISLEIHEKRTNELEIFVKLLESELKPVKNHVDRIKFLLGIVKWVGLPTMISIVGYFIKSYFVK